MPTDLKNISTHPEWVAIEEHLEDQRQKRISRLISGTCTEHEYQALAGEIRGIQLVLQTPYKKVLAP